MAGLSAFDCPPLPIRLMAGRYEAEYQTADDVTSWRKETPTSVGLAGPPSRVSAKRVLFSRSLVGKR